LSVSPWRTRDEKWQVEMLARRSEDRIMSRKRTQASENQLEGWTGGGIGEPCGGGDVAGSREIDVKKYCHASYPGKNTGMAEGGRKGG